MENGLRSEVEREKGSGRLAGWMLRSTTASDRLLLSPSSLLLLGILEGQLGAKMQYSFEEDG